MQIFLDYIRQAEALLAEGQFDEARSLWDALICAHPNEPAPMYGMGVTLGMMGRDGEAIPVLSRAAELDGNSPQIWVALGGILRRQEHVEEARLCFSNALKIEPNSPEALKAQAGTYVNAGNPAHGEALARKALKYCREGDDVRAHAVNDLALCLLEQGKWEEGWKHYANRSNIPGYHIRDYGPIPRWTGERVKVLALHPEQGVGDEILFASCLPDVLERVDSVVMECMPRLVELFSRSFPWVKFFGSHAEVMNSGLKIDAWERLGDLPGRYRPAPAACPGLPYLKADPAKVAGYRARLEATGPGPYIGIAWKGGTKMTHESVRNAPKDLWAKLISEISGTCISLQYGPRGKSNAEAFDLIHWSAAIDDLDEFAALVSACDQVITVCQTAVHFAGALGIPCWVATPSKPAWRYFGNDERMAWYGSVKLVRQKGDDWGPVFQAFKVALQHQTAKAA